MRWLLKKRLAFTGHQKGLTFIEVLIALGIIGFVATGYLTALNSNSRATRSLEEHTVAASLASSCIEAIKDDDFSPTYPHAGDDITIPFQYSMDIDTQFSIDGTTWSEGYAGENLQKITVIVSREGRPVFSVCTYKTQR